MSTELMVAVITAVTTSILGPIAVHYFKMMVEKKKKDPLADSIEANQLITDKLEEVKNKEHADRIWILQFHNGGNYYPTGKSIQKFSMVYEMLGQGIIPCQHQLQNIPVSLFSRTINNLHKGFVVSIPDTSIENKQFEGFTSVIPGAGVKSTYLFPVYTIKNEFVAIVGIDYISKKKNLTNQEINDIDLELSTIGGVLNNYLQV
jgi:hypothetical protein